MSGALNVAFEPGSAMYRKLGTNFAYGIPKEKFDALRKGLTQLIVMAPTLRASCESILDVLATCEDEFALLEILRDVHFDANGKATIADCDSGRLLALMGGYLIGGDGESFRTLALTLPERGIHVKVSLVTKGHLVLDIFGESLELKLMEVN